MCVLHFFFMSIDLVSIQYLHDILGVGGYLESLNLRCSIGIHMT